MKKFLSLTLLSLLVGLVSSSQAPAIFNYQGVARNSVGNVLVNKTITLRLTIRDLTPAGALVYQESRTVITNPFGLFNVQVGSGGATNITGTIPGVNWAVGNKYIQVEIDPNGGTTFINIGTAQIASVPYAWFAQLSADLVLPFNKTQADAGTLFKITNSGTGSGSIALEGLTNSTAGNVSGIMGTVTSTAPGGFSAGVRGVNNGTGGNGIGVYGSQNGSGWGVYGTTPSGRGVYGFSPSGVGLYGSTTTGRALRTDGAIQFTGINEAVNRIMATLDGLGNATWVDPSAVGIVTGSGTVNFVPKWTPTGTNLGNSQIFDNGTNVGIGTTTPTAKFSINELFKVTSTGTVQYANSVNPMMIMFESGTANADRMVIGHSPAFPTWGLQYQDAPDKFNFLGAGTPVLTADLGAQRVGVNVVSPIGKFHAVGAGANYAPIGSVQAHAAAVLAENNVASGATLNAGIVTYANGSTTGNRGIFGVAGGSGTAFNIGVGGIANATSTGPNYGIVGFASSGSSNWAGAFFGKVQIQDGSQAVNRVFTSDAAGTGTWMPLGAIGGVGGSGTLNYVAKWTPDGFTLGNSQIFDNGNTVTVGGNFTASNSLTVIQTPASPVNTTVGMITASQAGGMYLEESSGDIHFTANANIVASGNKIMTLEDIGLNVGINTTTPINRMKLHVEGYGVAGPPFDQASIYANGSLGATDGHGVVANGEWRGVWGRNPGAGGRVEASGIRGDANGSNYFFGFGARGLANGSGLENYGVYGVASGGTNRNVGVYGSAAVAANSFGGYFDGKILINDGTQAAGRILTSIGATGEATWSTAAGAGLVSGSGTLNFIPKWTPNGTTLGDAQLFDNGSFVTIGSTAFVGAIDYSTTIANTTGSPQASLIFASSAGEANGIYNDNNGMMHFTANSGFVGASTILMTMDDDGTQGVGIGTSTVSAKLRVNSAHTVAFGVPTTAPSASGIVVEHNSATALNSGIQAYTNGGTSENYGVFGVSGGSASFNMGGLFLAQTGSAGSNFGIIARASGGTTNTAGWFQGTVQITDGTQGVGNTFTSDGAGRGHWQPTVAFAIHGLSSTVNMPLFTYVPITQWATVDYEVGSSGAYNSVTGEYTVPVSGKYHFSVDLVLNTPPANGNGYAGMSVFVNGVDTHPELTICQTTVLYNGIKLNGDVMLTAGDVVQIQAFHNNSGVVSTFNSPPTINQFNIHMVK
jgi:hypothetical protein